MAKQFKGQLEGEEVLFVFKRHPIVMRKGLLMLMIAVVIGAFFGLFMSSSATDMGQFFIKFFSPVGIGLLVGAICLFYFWIGWHYSIGIVTNKRFIQFNQVGIFKSRSVNDIDLHRILSVNYEVHGIIETVLGFGTIIVQTLVGDLVITRVSHPAETQSKIVTAIKESGVELDEEAESLS